MDDKNKIIINDSEDKELNLDDLDAVAGGGLDEATVNQTTPISQNTKDNI